MTEIELLEFLGQSRKMDQVNRRESVSYEHANGLTFARARALALNPNLWTGAERVHVASCRRCAHLVESLERNMVHPSWWHLLCHVLEKETVEEARAMQYHLVDGDCQHCGSVVATLQKVSPQRLADWFARQLQAPPTEVDTESTSSGSGEAGGTEPNPLTSYASQSCDGCTAAVARVRSTGPDDTGSTRAGGSA